MRKVLRTKAGQRAGAWFRAAGITFLLVAFFAPLPGWAIAVTLIPGAFLFLIGATAWLVRDGGPWLR